GRRLRAAVRWPAPPTRHESTLAAPARRQSPRKAARFGFRQTDSLHDHSATDAKPRQNSACGRPETPAVSPQSTNLPSVRLAVSKDARWFRLRGNALAAKIPRTDRHAPRTSATSPAAPPADFAN